MRLWDKRIPTLLAVIVLMVGVVVTSILVRTGVIVFQHAAPSDAPQNLRITNISDTGFTVTYTTDTNVTGTISLSDAKDKAQVVLDDRDEQDGVPKQYTVHSISAKNLSPNTSYSFTILSGITSYLNGDKPFTLTTPTTLSDTATSTPPLAGKVVLPDGTKPTEALVFVTTNNGQLLSTLLNAAGLYILPLNTLRTKDFSSFMHFSSDTTLQILATNQTLTSHATIGMVGSNPVPAITLSQDYDFTIANTPVATGAATAGFPVLSFANSTLNATPEIISPKKDESFSDQQPQFSGTATPHGAVTISVHSDTPVTTQVTADANGNWVYRPSSPLAPGEHTITVTSPDSFGILHTLTQSFTVYAAGTTVDQTATPSATLAPTKIPTLSPTAIPTKSVITPSTAISPTIIPTGNISTAPTPRATLPPTGSNTVAVAGIAGVATTVIGILLFLVTTGATL